MGFSLTKTIHFLGTPMTMETPTCTFYEEPGTPNSDELSEKRHVRSVKRLKEWAQGRDAMDRVPSQFPPVNSRARGMQRFQDMVFELHILELLGLWWIIYIHTLLFNICIYIYSK